MESSATRTEPVRHCVRVAPEGPSQGSPAKTRLTHALGWHLEDLSDFEFRLVVRGPPAVLKNSKQIVTLPGRRPILVSSRQAKAYQKTATEQLRAQWSSVFCEPVPREVEVSAAFVAYLPTRRRTDLSNLYQGPEDAMQAAGVLTDDAQIASHDGSRRRHDPQDPRVEITITRHRGAP